MEFDHERRLLTIDNSDEVEAALVALATVRRTIGKHRPEDREVAVELEDHIEELDSFGETADDGFHLSLDSRQTLLLIEGALSASKNWRLARARKLMPTSVAQSIKSIGELSSIDR